MEERILLLPLHGRAFAAGRAGRSMQAGAVARQGLAQGSAASGSCCWHRGAGRVGSFASARRWSSSHLLGSSLPGCSAQAGFSPVLKTDPNSGLIYFSCNGLDRISRSHRPVYELGSQNKAAVFLRLDFCVFRAWGWSTDGHPLPLP